MEFITHSHRHGMTLFENEEPFRSLWQEIAAAVGGISDDELADRFEAQIHESKSISAVLNAMLKERFGAAGWAAESPIFADEGYMAGDGGRYRLDFAKDVVSVEVAFNHGEAAAWNLLKPVMASELNHVRKAIQTEAGVIITATDAMKAAGGFDSAVGSFEKYVQYLRPLNDVLSVPLVVIGLLPPSSFEIVHISDGRRKLGRVRRP
ncbi:MAG: hypothetical protein FDZ70_01230 [Actinobacteria bacterium]|nr:MAG: hypothetical protein FDZ70_01230 [Actinomycetota bacterium]